jgi:uncharacterized protein
VRIRLLALLLCAGSVLSAAPALAAQCEDLPKHSNFPVADTANVVDPQGEAYLIADLARHQAMGGEAIVAATVQTTGGDDISSYAKRLFDCWGVGDAESDNGILILIAMRERRVRIEVGAGLEGRLGEAELEAALDEMVAPLRRGDVAAGLRAAAVSLVDDLGGRLSDTRNGTNGAGPPRQPGDVKDVVDGTGLPAGFDPPRDVTPYSPRNAGGSALAALVPIVIVLGVVAKIAGALFRGGGFSGGGSTWRGGFPGSGVGFGTASMFRGGGWHSAGSSGWSGHSSGPSSFGGSSGSSGGSGGGSSFGGGSSGGGGASGSW